MMWQGHSKDKIGPCPWLSSKGEARQKTEQLMAEMTRKHLGLADADKGSDQKGAWREKREQIFHLVHSTDDHKAWVRLGWGHPGL